MSDQELGSVRRTNSPHPDADTQYWVWGIEELDNANDISLSCRKAIHFVPARCSLTRAASFRWTEGHELATRYQRFRVNMHYNTLLQQHSNGTQP